MLISVLTQSEKMGVLKILVGCPETLLRLWRLCVSVSLRWNDRFQLGAEAAVIAKCWTRGYNEGLSLIRTNSNACGGREIWQLLR